MNKILWLGEMSIHLVLVKWQFSQRLVRIDQNWAYLWEIIAPLQPFHTLKIKSPSNYGSLWRKPWWKSAKEKKFLEILSKKNKHLCKKKIHTQLQQQQNISEDDISAKLKARRSSWQYFFFSLRIVKKNHRWSLNKSLNRLSLRSSVEMPIDRLMVMNDIFNSGEKES